MLEEVWPEIGNAWVSGVLAGGGSILVQWLAPKAAELLKRLRADKLRLERRLAAILAADVVGYSRLMSADEEGTHFRLLAYRRDVIAPKVREHRGRIVKHTGDGALVEFGSVVDAVRCALEVQQNIRTRNAGLPQDRRIEFRIGVNLGDVIVAPDDIYGHGVNVASRLEGLAGARRHLHHGRRLAPCAGCDRRRVRRSRREAAEEHRRSGACLRACSRSVTPGRGLRSASTPLSPTRK
jgi:class 3 adenylate cyclase